MKPRSITAFFPAYNDGGTIASLVILALRTLPRVTDDYEVVVVNDGSGDHTAAVLDELVNQYPDHVRVVHHAQNRGYGGALRSGFAHARKEWVFYTDGDGQYDPRELVNLAAGLSEDTDIVNGYKIVRHDPFHRVVIGRLYHHLTRLAFGILIRDVDCDFRLIRRSLLESLPLESETGTICVEMVRRLQDAGARFVEVPVHHFHRACGRSQFFQFRRLCGVARHLVRLWWKLVVRHEHLVRMPAPLLSHD